MADKQASSLRKINKSLDGLKSYVDNLYSSTYSTRVDNKNDLNRITDSIENDLDDIISSVNGQNVSNIANLIIRLQRKNGYKTDQIMDELQDLISDKSILDVAYMENISKYIQAQNYQYDLLLKYLPKLYQALEIMKDSVLSADNFTKDFVNVVGNKTNKEYLNIFNSKAKKCLEKYDIQNLYEEMYMETAIYGEYFLYQVPYKKAFERLLKRKNAPTKLYESAEVEESKVIFESASFAKTEKVCKNIKSNPYSEYFLDEIAKANSTTTLYMDPYGLIPKAVEAYGEAMRIKDRYSSVSICESYLQESDGTSDNNFRRGVATLQYEPITQMPVDGFVNRDDSSQVKDIAGCIMYKIPRENIIPIYIGDFCVGYIYFNFINDYITKNVVTSNMYNSITASSDVKEEEFEKQQETLVAQIAASIGEQIDAKFINTNTDLKDEIYSVLRYNTQFNPLVGNNKITVSFLPEEDVHHFYFKMNKKTHRGISDLERAVVPAMLAILLKLTDTINKVSRSQDKRIYYVKQNVETNVARTMLNVVNQLKKGNMGLRQLESMNTIFNIVGKYSDHIIPMSPSGEAPIQFEVMQGQNSETPTELITNMEQDAVDSTDVPYEWVDSTNQVDFATRFTMSNSKFLRKVYKRQAICQKHFSQIFQKTYNYEYNENETQITVRLPAPAFLSMTNSQTLIDNNKNFYTALADISLQDQEELKPLVINAAIRDALGTYIDFDKWDKLIEQAKQEMNVKATENQDVSAEELANDEEF